MPSLKVVINQETLHCRFPEFSPRRIINTQNTQRHCLAYDNSKTHRTEDHPLNTLILGNAGSGKSTLAGALSKKEHASCLSLDDIAFAAGAQRKPLNESVDAALQFIQSNPHWIIEGCYADIAKPLLAHVQTFIFLNPGIDTCIKHCHARPWEPDKFPSQADQDAHLHKLIDWVRSYETRDDEYGLKQHQALFNSFTGEKFEYRDPQQYPH